MTPCVICRVPSIDGPLCPWCLLVSGQEIAALPLDVRELAALQPATGGPLQRVSGTRAPSVPVDLEADALIRDIVWRLCVWEPPVREAVMLDPADDFRLRPEECAARAARVLSAHVDAFSRLGPTWGYPDGLEAGCVARSGLYGVLSLRRLHVRAVAMLDAGPPPVTHMPGLCDGCGAAALTRTAGSGQVMCSLCHHTVSDSEYARLLVPGTGDKGTSSSDRVKRLAPHTETPPAPCNSATTQHDERKPRVFS